MISSNSWPHSAGVHGFNRAPDQVIAFKMETLDTRLGDHDITVISSLTIEFMLRMASNNIQLPIKSANSWTCSSFHHAFQIETILILSKQCCCWIKDVNFVSSIIVLRVIAVIIVGIIVKRVSTQDEEFATKCCSANR